jgi:hypothetical protein
LLDGWADALARFARVMAVDYKKALEAQRAELQGVAV